jgi:hypothetical protein
MAEQMLVLFPKTTHKTPFGKHFDKHFDEVADYDKTALRQLAKKYDLRALKTFLIWISSIGLIFLIKEFGFIQNIHVYFVSVLFYFFDHFCINIWCPFHKILVRNKCCNTCRIFNWGHFMIFSPLIIVPNFYTVTLFITSLVVLIQWEVNHYLHPERFYEISNSNLKCSHCDIECRFKK